MKKTLLLGLFFVMSHMTYSQSLTLTELKALKNKFQSNIIQVKDEDIIYPVTGVIDINVTSSLMGETIVEVEVWVVDSKGKIVYNNIFAAKDLSEKNFDRDYMRYMKMQGRKLVKRRHFFLSNNEHKTGDS